MSAKAQAYLLILRWTIALIFFANGVPKLWDEGFGVNAESFFISLKDDVIFSPYKRVLEDLVIPNAYIFASIVKYSEIAIGIAFFLGWPLKLATLGATFLHLNYLCIASFPTFIYLNIIMIVAEWATMNVFSRDT